MFEKPLSSLIASHLRKFLQDISEEQLRLSVWKGEVCLENLQLRDDIFDQISLLVWQQSSANNLGVAASPALASLLMPFTVVKGTVQSLKISIPWASLDSEPVVVEVDGVDLIVGPLRHRPYSKEEEQTREEAVKKTQLAAFESCVAADREAKAKAAAPAAEKKSDEVAALASALASTEYIGSDLADEQIMAKSAGLGISAFFERIVSNVSRNIQFTISNINVGFTFDYVGLHPRSAFALDCLIDKVTIVPVNEVLKPARVAADARLRRRISIEGLQLKCSMGKAAHPSVEPSQTKEAFWDRTHVVIEPFNAAIVIQERWLEAPSEPINVREISVEVNPIHVRAVGEVVACVQNAVFSITKALDYAPHRPFLDRLTTPCGFSHNLEAAQRWRFALEAVLEDLRRQRRGSEVLSTFLKAKPRYISLFKRSKGLEWLPPLDTLDEQRIVSMEEVMPFDQIAVLRSIAYAEIDVERIQHAQHQEMITRAKGAHQQRTEGASGTGGGWGSWLGWRGGSQPTTPLVSGRGKEDGASATATTSEGKEGWSKYDLAAGIDARLRQYDDFKRGHSILSAPTSPTSPDALIRSTPESIVRCTMASITLIAAHQTLPQTVRLTAHNLTVLMSSKETRMQTSVQCRSVGLHLIESGEQVEMCELITVAGIPLTDHPAEEQPPQVAFERGSTGVSSLSIERPQITIPSRERLLIIRSVFESFIQVKKAVPVGNARNAFLEGGGISPPKSPVLPKAATETLLNVTVRGTSILLRPTTQLAHLAIPTIAISVSTSGHESRTTVDVPEAVMVLTGLEDGPFQLSNVALSAGPPHTSVRVGAVGLTVTPHTGPAVRRIIDAYTAFEKESGDTNHTSTIQTTPSAITYAPPPEVAAPVTLVAVVCSVSVTVRPLTSHHVGSTVVLGTQEVDALRFTQSGQGSRLEVGQIVWGTSEFEDFFRCNEAGIAISPQGIQVALNAPRVRLTSHIHGSVAVLAGTVGSITAAPLPSSPQRSHLDAPAKDYATSLVVTGGIEVSVGSTGLPSLTLVLDAVNVESNTSVSESPNARVNASAIFKTAILSLADRTEERLLATDVPLTWASASTQSEIKNTFSVGRDPITIHLSPLQVAAVENILASASLGDLAEAASVNQFEGGIPHHHRNSVNKTIPSATLYLEGRIAPININLVTAPSTGPTTTLTLLATSEIVISSHDRHIPGARDAVTEDSDISSTVVTDIVIKAIDVAGALHVGDVHVHVVPSATIRGIPSSMHLSYQEGHSATYVVVGSTIVLSLSPQSSERWIRLSRQLVSLRPSFLRNCGSPSPGLGVVKVGSAPIWPSALGVSINGIRAVAAAATSSSAPDATKDTTGHFVISLEGLGLHQTTHTNGDVRTDVSAQGLVVEDSSRRPLPDPQLPASHPPAADAKLMPDAFKLAYVESVAFTSYQESSGSRRVACQVEGAILCPVERSLALLRDSILPEVAKEEGNDAFADEMVSPAPSAPTSPTTKNAPSVVNVSLSSLELRLCEPWLEPVAAITMNKTEIALTSGPNTLMPECANDVSTFITVTYLEGIGVTSLERAHIGTPLESILTPAPDTAISLTLELATTAPAWHKAATVGLTKAEYNRTATRLYVGRGVDVRATGLHLCANQRTLSRIMDNVFSQLLFLGYLGEPLSNRLPTYFSAVRVSNRLKVSISDLTVAPPIPSSVSAKISEITITNTVSMSDVLKWRQLDGSEKAWQHSYENIAIQVKGLTTTPHLTSQPVDLDVAFGRPMTFTSHTIAADGASQEGDQAIVGTLFDFRKDLPSTAPCPLIFTPTLVIVTPNPIEVLVSAALVERILTIPKWSSTVVSFPHHLQDCTLQVLSLTASLSNVSLALTAAAESNPRLRIGLGNQLSVRSKNGDLGVSCMGYLRVLDQSGGVVLCGHQQSGLVDVQRTGSETCVQVRDVGIDVNGHRMLSLLKAFDVVESVLAVVQPSPPTPEDSSRGVQVVVLDEAKGDTAPLSAPQVLKISTFNVRISIPGYTDLVSKALSVTQTTTSTQGATVVAVSVTSTDVLLLDRRPSQSAGKPPIVVVSGTTADISGGAVTLGISSVLVNNDSTFIGDVFMAATDVHAHLYRKWKRRFTGSPTQQEGPAPIYDSNVELNINRFTLKMTTNSASETRSTLTLIYPGISLRQATSASASSLTIDALGGSLQLHDGARTLRPLCSGINLHLVQSSTLTGTSTRIALPEAFLSVPGGAPLHGCTSVAAETLAPFLSLIKVFADSNSGNDAQSRGGMEIPFKPSTITVEAGRVGFEIFEFDAASGDDVVIVSVAVQQPTLTLTTTPSSEQIQLSVGGISSTAEEGLQSSPLTCVPRPATREGRDSASHFAFFVVRETITTLEGAKERNVLRCGDFHVALSPQLIHILHRDIVEPAAAGVRAASMWVVAQRRGGLDETTASNVSDYFATATSLSDDFTFAEGVSVGGPSSSTLHIRKTRTSPNVIHLRGQHGATLHLHRGLEAAIVVDDGISVYCDEGLSIVLEKPGDVLADYVSLGNRSFIKINPTHIRYRQSGATAAGAIMHRRTTSQGASRRFERVWDVDAHIGLELSNRSQICSVGTSIQIDYSIVVDADSKTTLSEVGKIACPRFAVETSCGRVPVHLSTQVVYRGPSDGNEVGRTTVNMILEGVSIRASHQDVGLIRDGVSVASAMATTVSALALELQEMTLRHDAAFDPALDRSASGATSRKSLLQKPAPDAVVADLGRTVAEVSNESQVYLVFNSPSVELLLQDDQRQMMGSFTMNNTIVQVTGKRDLSSLSIAANCWVIAEDKPFGWGVPRVLLDAQPEVVMTLDRLNGGGVSCEAAAAFPRTVATLPLPSLMSFLNHTFREPPRGSLAVVNATGVPLYLYPVKAVEKRHSRLDSISGEYLQDGATRQFGADYHLGACFYITTAASQQNAEPTPPIRVPFGLQVDEPGFLPELSTTANMLFAQYMERDRTVVLTTGAFVHSSFNENADPALSLADVDARGIKLPIPYASMPAVPIPFSLLPLRVHIISSNSSTPPHRHEPLPPLETLVGMARSEAAPAEGIQVVVPVGDDGDSVVLTVLRRRCTIAAHAKVDFFISPRVTVEVGSAAKVSISPATATKVSRVGGVAGTRSVINFCRPPGKISFAIDSVGVPCESDPVDLGHHTDYDAITQLVFKDPFGRTATLDLVRLHENTSLIHRYAITPKNTVRNHLPVAFHLVGAKGTLLAGTLDANGAPLGLQPNNDLVLCNDVATARLQLLDPIFATSQEFTLRSTVATTIAAVKAPLVHIASIYYQGGVTHVAPLWTVTNNSSLTLSVEAHKSTPTIDVPPSGGMAQLMTFDSTTATDPVVTFHVEGYEGFKVPLATISLKSARGVFYGLLRSNGVARTVEGEEDEVAVLKDTSGNLCSVACLSLEIVRAGDHRVGIKVDVLVEDSKFPISIENRLPTPALVEQPNSDKVYNVGPYHTAPMAWDSFKDTNQILNLHLTHPTTKRQLTVVVDLQRLPHSIEGIVVGDIVINPTITGGRVVLSISADRMLSTLLITSPRSCFNASIFVRSLEVHVTSLVSTKVGSYFYDRVLEGDFGSHAADGPEAFLKRREMDLVRIFTENLAVGFTENGKHQLVQLGMRSLRIEDVMKTSPRLASIVAIHPDAGADEHKPSIRLMLHQVTNDGTASNDIKVLRFETNTVWVALADRLLHTLRGAGERLTEINHEESVEFDDTSSSTQSATTSHGAGRLLEQAVCIEKLFIGSIPLRLTISRRSDVRYNPFSGIPLSNILMQSIDCAPLTLREITAANVVVPEGRPVLGYLATQLMLPAYRTDVILQVYKVLGSMEVLGNPVMFTSQISTGLRDFVVSTATLHPVEGMSSLLRATSSSALHTYSLFSRASGRLVGSLTFDRKWLEQCDDPSRNALLSGLEEGATGLVSAPMRGAREGGFAGFMAGVASGASGVLTKPLSGALVQMARLAETSSSALRRTPVAPVEIEDRYFPATRNYLDDEEAIVAHPSYAPTPRSIGDVLDEYEHLLPTNPLSIPAASHVYFITRRQYIMEAVRLNKTSKSPKAAASTKGVSVHTRALCNVVGAHNFAQYAPLAQFLEVSTPEEYLLWAHLALYREVTEKLSAMGPQQRTLTKNAVDAAAMERTMHLRATLGSSQMLKYVTLSQYAAIVSWGEARAVSNPRTFKDKVGPAIWAEVQRVVINMGVQNHILQADAKATPNTPCSDS